MEESSKFLKFYQSTRYSLQLRYFNRFYTKKTRNRPNNKNNEFVCSTADCYATVFLAVTLILGVNISLPSHYQFFGLMISIYHHATKKTNRFLWTLKSCRKLTFVFLLFLRSSAKIMRQNNLIILWIHISKQNTQMMLDSPYKCGITLIITITELIIMPKVSVWHNK